MIDEFGQEIGEPCEECGAAQGKFLIGYGQAGILVCKECAEAWEDERLAQEARDEGLTTHEIDHIESPRE